MGMQGGRLSQTLASWSSFSLAVARIFSSMGVAVTSRSTRTSCFCPMRCARAIACRSICGFQSESKRMTVSALCRLRPRPPARVESMNMKWGELGALNCASRSPRSSPLVLPSSRKWQYRIIWQYSSSRFMSCTICEKTSTLCPSALSLGRMRSSSSNLPDERQMCKGVRTRASSCCSGLKKRYG